MGNQIDGKQVVITGATAGIGKATALELARRGAALALVSRNPAKADGVAEEIRAVAPKVDLRLFTADLSVLSEVRRVAAEIDEGLDRIDVLVNNAGIAARSDKQTEEGFDEMLAANYLGPFLLTHLLLPALRRSKSPRIVVVGSEAHRVTGRFDPESFEHMGTYRGLRTAQNAYGRTKLLDVLFADELARRLGSDGPTVNSLCPGMVGTDLAGDLNSANKPMAMIFNSPLVRKPERGARMSVHLASSPDVEGHTGTFFSSTRGAGLMPTAGPRRKPQTAARVYERTCELVGIDGL